MKNSSSVALLDEAVDGTGKPVRVAILVSHPIQYFTPWYRSMAATSGVVVKVFFCRKWGAEAYFDHDFEREVKWDIPLLEGYDWEFLKAEGDLASQGFWAVDNPGVGDALSQFQPEVVMLHGYAQRTLWRAARWCSRHRVPVMLYSDSSAKTKRPFWKRAAKACVVRAFYRGVDGVFSSGDNNRAYHRLFGVPPERCFDGLMPIDRDRILLSAGLASGGDGAVTRREIRARYGIPDDAFVIIYAGKLIPLKCVSHLLEALRRCGDPGWNVWGLLVGDGPERPALESFVSTHAMKNVIFAGFVNQASIGKYYAASDVVALMSWREAKGLPVPEAGCLGCPAILSDRVGCIGPNDSARSGENALVYHWNDIDGLTGLILSLYHDPVRYRRMSSSARRIAALQDISIAAAQFREAARSLRAMGCRG